MAFQVRDHTGRQFIVGDGIRMETLLQPLVTERREVFSFPFGNAEMVQLAFSGIYVVYGDMRLYEALKLNFEMVDTVGLVEMHFALGGQGTMMNEVNGKVYSFKPNEHNMHYTPIFKGEGEYGGNQHFKFFEVHFTKSFFFELAKDSSPMLMEFAECIQKGNDADLVRENLPMSFAMHQCINDIMHVQLTGGLKLLFLQSKCIELLALQAQMYEDAARRSSSACKSNYDKECIYYAKDYLLQHAIQPPSLTELAKIAGINEFKLKHGFKEVFNNTVFGYLSDYKLGQAKELLHNDHISIKEVATQLGYSSVQHFNTAFRKKFGVTPGALKKK